MCVRGRSVRHTCERWSVRHALPAGPRGGVQNHGRVPRSREDLAACRGSGSGGTVPEACRVPSAEPTPEVSSPLHPAPRQEVRGVSQTAAEDAELGWTGLPPDLGAAPEAQAPRRLAGREFRSLVLAEVREVLAERLPLARHWRRGGRLRAWESRDPKGKQPVLGRSAGPPAPRGDETGSRGGSGSSAGQRAGGAPPGVSGAGVPGPPCPGREQRRPGNGRCLCRGRVSLTL